MDSKQQEIVGDQQYIGSLIHEGFYDKLIIIGFPYDEGAKRSGARGGADYGPDSFRRFVKEIGSIQNPEYNVDISKGLQRIADYGNIQINYQPPQPKPSHQELLHKLTQKVSLCIQRQNIPFVIGGSRELFGAVADAMLLQDKRSAFVSISHCLDVQPLLDQGTPHQKSCKRYILEKENFGEKHVLYEFGLNGQEVKESDCEYFKERNPNGKIIWLQDIKKIKKFEKEGINTKAGQAFYELLNGINANENIDQTYVSLNLENIDGAVGVSTNCLNGGLSTEEAIEICLLIGLYCNKLVAFDITEYNPFVEDWRTGRLVATMFYYFVLGLSIRLQSSPTKLMQ